RFDADPMLFNTLGGVADLRAGTMLAHAREQLLTHIADATPDGECPIWLGYLNDCTLGDKPLQRFLQDLAGYCLTGSTEEHKMFFIVGAPRNGKTTFIET